MYFKFRDLQDWLQFLEYLIFNPKSVSSEPKCHKHQIRCLFYKIK